MPFRERGKDFNPQKLNIKEWFIKRGYPESVIEREMKKVCFSKQGQNLERLRWEYHLL